MANELRSTQGVKFYKLGSANTSVSRATYETYRNGNDTSSGIIFARVFENNKTHQYIWANGIEYNVADASKFEELIDNASNNGTYTNANSVHKWIQDAIANADVDITAEKVYNVIDASNKKGPQDASAIQAIKNSREGVEVSIGKFHGNTSTLAIGIDLDKIYLPHGVQRTEAIGMFSSSQDVLTEGVGWSVKELLEYWLLKEQLPICSCTAGSGGWTAATLSITGFPQTDNISSYIYIKNTDNNWIHPTNGMLVEPYLDISVLETSGMLSNFHLTGDTAVSKTSTKASITGLKYGYATGKGQQEGDGHWKPTGKSTNNSITGTAVTVTASYTYDASAQVTTKFTMPDNTTRSTTLKDKWIINASNASTKVGANNFKLKITHNATASRNFTQAELNKTIPGINSVYVISNKGHVYADGSANSSVKAPSGTFNRPTTIDITKYNSGAEQTFSITGVWPIFTNGTGYANAPATSGSGTDRYCQNICKWQNSTWNLADYDPDASIKFNFLINNTGTVYVGFGTGPDEGGKDAVIYVHKNRTVTFAKSGTWNADEHLTFAGWENYSAAPDMGLNPTITNVSVYVNGVKSEYRKYTWHGTAGPNVYQVTIS